MPPVPLPEGGVILDLGCNVGFTVAHYAAAFPSVHLVGYELDESNYHMALRNTRDCGARCTVVHAGVWSRAGILAYAGCNHAAFRLIDCKSEEPVAGRTETRTVSRILDEHALVRVDYLKMDIEGAEKEVIAGEDGWLDRIGALKVEIHDPAAFSVIQARLESRGFLCVRDRVHWSCCVAVREVPRCGS